MAEIKFGHVEGPGQGREYPVAASQYFARRGGKFVYLNSGNVTLCASGSTKVMGWAESPKDTSGANSWVSSASAGADKVFVVYGMDDVFELPFHEGNASIAVTLIGAGAGIVNATIGDNTGANTTPAAGTAQYAKTGTTASPLSIVDVDTVNKTVKVKIKAGNKQAK